MRGRRLILWTAVLAIGLAALVAAGAVVLTRAHLAEGRARAEDVLRLTVDGLSGHLQRYRALPALLADDEDVRAFIERPASRPDMNDWLEQTAAALEASDIYIIGRDGVTLAASNHARPDSFVGEDFSYRPYFREALAGREARFYGLGTTSGVRGYYFSAPVRDPAGRIGGAIAFKIALDRTEESWRGAEARIFVTDPEGIVFLSSDPAMLYRAMEPLDAGRIARTEASRRYADAAVAPLDFARTARGLAMGGREYLEVTRPMPDAGWTVHALLDTAPLLAGARLALLASVLVVCVLGAAAALVLQRRALQAEARRTLERRVAERTADLGRVNALIETEIAERRATEAELRRTQADLVQAGKLAALGRMSAALSHEMNQPLAAARNYADSAAILIERGDTARARENVGQIVALVDRMAAIATHLRNMARRPNRRQEDLSLPDAVADAVAIATPHLRQAGAVVAVDLPDLPLVRGSAVGLQQVLVNLLTNAADAAPAARIEIGATLGPTIALWVRDHGAGVPDALAERIFDPFFSTKQGSGLGLGLSISYNAMKDMNGDLRVANHPEGGAVFTLTLHPATGRMAAE